MSKHTPGPWKAVHRREIEAVSVFEVAEISSFRIIRDVVGDGFDGHGTDDADARLIAAAPELLKALESVAEIWDHHCFAHGDGVPTPCHAQVRAVIAKAKGEV